MNYKIFDDKIITPVKCGTRYLEKMFPIYKHSSHNTIYREEGYKKKEYWYLYRSPMEHIVSALQTEFLSVLNGVEKLSIEELLKRFQRGINDGFGTTHWCPQLCERLHTHWSYNKRVVHLVELTDLTPTLISIGYDVIQYDKDDYDFKHYKIWWSKDECVNFVKENHPMAWEYLYNTALIDNEYYIKLKNRESLEIKLI